ncbi:Proteasome-associated ATPase [Streptomyces cyaneofuscatus]
MDEFKENEDLPNTTNPDDWARISGKKGERIVFIRTLVTGKQGADTGRSIDTVANTGQYLTTPTGCGCPEGHPQPVVFPRSGHTGTMS